MNLLHIIDEELQTLQREYDRKAQYARDLNSAAYPRWKARSQAIREARKRLQDRELTIQLEASRRTTTEVSA